MAETKTIKVSKNGSAQWTSLNPILEDKEIGVEIDTQLFKVGNGIGRWRDLAHVASGGKNALFVFLSDDPDNLLALTTDGGIFLSKKLLDGLAAYNAGKEQGAAAPTPPDEYNATMIHIGKDVNTIMSSLVLHANRLNDLEGRELGDKIDDAATSTSTTWSSHEINDKILESILELKADITNNPNGAYDALVRLAQFLEDNNSVAVTIAEELGGTVRFATEQTLTAAQKVVALTNIGAVGALEMGDTSTLLADYEAATASATGSPFENSEI